MTLSVVCSQLGILVLLLITSSTVTWPLYLYACFFGLGYGARGPILSAIALISSLAHLSAPSSG